MITSGVAGGGELLGPDLSVQDLRQEAKHPEPKGLVSNSKYSDGVDNNPLAALEGPLAAMLNQGFFSPVTTLGSDPDGAGGAMTLGPASAVAAAMMFKLESDPNLIPV
jgi:hypothetical protein